MKKLKGKPDVKVVVDLQFGSTGKGVIVGHIAQEWNPTAIATGWGTNAGHTMITKQHGKRIATQLASAAVVESVSCIFVGGGSMINPFTFVRELEKVRQIRNDLGYPPVDVIIVNTASIILPQHEKEEAGLVSIGSTMKGNSAALAQKLSRNPLSMNVMGRTPTYLESQPDVTIVPMSEYIDLMCHQERILVEGAQGFSLGLNQDFYPFCTSRECTPQQICTEAGIPFNWVTSVIGCLRTYPIRVANRYEGEKQVGWSGGYYSDQDETTFDSIGQETERTTVTNLPRRVFTFSKRQLEQALIQCAPTELFLNFCNYCESEDDLAQIINTIQLVSKDVGYQDRCPLKYMSWTADSDQVQVVPESMRNLDPKILIKAVGARFIVNT